MDTIAPTISAVTPIDGDFVFPSNVEVSFTVDDVGAGINTERIELHLDNDKDGVTVDDTDMFAIPAADVTTIGGSQIINIPMPNLGADGTASWFVKIFDIAGNSTRSDADLSTDGDQDGIVIIDTLPPRIISAVAGERFDDESEEIVVDQAEWVHITFDEDIVPESVVPVLVSVNGRQADLAITPAAMPASLFLHVPKLQGNPDELDLGAGTVQDPAGLKNVQHLVRVVDSLSPRLTVSLNSTYVNSTLNLEITSNESLSSLPAVSIDGRSVDSTSSGGPRKWQYQIDLNELDATRSGEGVKNLVVTGFDQAGCLGSIGQESFADGYPDRAIQFEIDRQGSKPLISPMFGTKLKGWSTKIRVSFLGEANEYPGDSSIGAVITSATLNDVEITDQFTSIANGSLWEYETGTLPISSYLVRIESADLAGNILTPIETLFTISTEPSEELSVETPGDNISEEPPVDGEPTDGDSQGDPVLGDSRARSIARSRC